MKVTRSGNISNEFAESLTKMASKGLKKIANDDDGIPSTIDPVPQPVPTESKPVNELTIKIENMVQKIEEICEKLKTSPDQQIVNLGRILSSRLKYVSKNPKDNYTQLFSKIGDLELFIKRKKLEIEPSAPEIGEVHKSMIDILKELLVLRNRTSLSFKDMYFRE